MEEEINISQTDPALRALEDLIIDNPTLERLEALLDRFNIFEATGFMRQELRHSDFLAFLLDPRGNHGLGDTFVRRLLQQVLTAMSGASVLCQRTRCDRLVAVLGDAPVLYPFPANLG